MNELNLWTFVYFCNRNIFYLPRAGQRRAPKEVENTALGLAQFHINIVRLLGTTGIWGDLKVKCRFACRSNLLPLGFDQQRLEQGGMNMDERRRWKGSSPGLQ